MNDYIVKAITENNKFRIYALTGHDLVEKAMKNHETSRIASIVLGRALLGSLLVSSSVLKGEERMNLSFNGRGPIGKVVVEATANGVVRGYVTNPQLKTSYKEDGTLSVGDAVGSNGTLDITKFAPYSTPFIGQINLVDGEIGTDLTYYLAQSEQIPSLVGVSVYMADNDDVQYAAGFLIQALPGASDEEIAAIEKNVEQLPALHSLLAEGKTPEDIVQMLAGDQAIKILETNAIGLAKEPTKEDYAKMLKTLHKDEILAMINEDHGAEIKGKFSGKKIYFSEEELREILVEIDS